LDIRVEVRINDEININRISELTLKSNQFNLTTKRFESSEVKALIEDVNVRVLSLMVSDKFGESGLTGVIILRFVSDIAYIENFLMSCRVLGREIEFSIWKVVQKIIFDSGLTEIRSIYVPSSKNLQVKDFYERVGFVCSETNSKGNKYYNAKISEFFPPTITWINVTYVK